MKAFQFVLGVMFLAAACLLPLNAAAVEVAGDITIDTVWSKNLSPYIVTGDVIVLEDVTLTIEPGVVVEFQKTGSSDGYHLEVQGTLSAVGSQNDPILFTIDDKTYYWGHIEFTETSQPWNDTDQTGSVVEGCIIEYAGNGRVDSKEKASIRVTSASPLIRNNVIRYGKNDGIRTVSGIQTIADNQVHDTVVGIEVVNPEAGIITNNYLIANQQGIYVDSGTMAVKVSNNTVIAGSSEGHGAALGVNLAYHDTLSSYAWKQIAGPSAVLPPELESISLEIDTPEVDQDELITFQLTVTDETGLQDVDTVDINVTWENDPPMADAGADQTVTPGESVTLNGENSDDNDDNIASFEWTQTSGTDVTGGWDADGPLATFSAPGSDDVLIFQLRVVDARGLEDLDTVTIFVQDPDPINQLPSADAGGDQNVLEIPGDNVEVSLTGSGMDADGTIISYFWEYVDGPRQVEINSPASPNASFFAPSVSYMGESYTFKLTVTDNHWNQPDASADYKSYEDTVIINVLDTDEPPSNQPPVAKAGDNQTVLESDSSVSLNALDPGDPSYDPEDPDTALVFKWKQVSGIYVSLNVSGATAVFSVPDVDQDETLEFELTVEDSDGLRSSDRVQVDVNWVPAPVAANAGDNQETVVGYTVQLDASETINPDQLPISYLWEQVWGDGVVIPALEVDLYNAGGEKVYFTAPVMRDGNDEEDLVFQLTVDYVSPPPGVSKSITHVKVKRVLFGPEADAGPGQVVAYGTADVFLDGTNSSDPDGTIMEWKWTQTDGPKVTLADATTAAPHFDAPAQQGEEPYTSLIFNLTVTDNDGNTATDSVVINVRDDTQGGDLPLADAGDDQHAGSQVTVTLDGSASFDPDTQPDLMIMNNDLVYEAIAGVNDNGGVPGNLVGISCVVDGNSIMDFTANNLRNQDGNFSVYLFDWRNDNIQTIPLVDNWWGTISDAEITDLIFGNKDDPSLPVVTFDAAAAPVAGAGSDLTYPPMADAGEDQSGDPDTVITLSCSEGYDPAGDMTYRWTQTDGQAVGLQNAGQCKATFIVPPVSEENAAEEDSGTLTFQLKVSDAYGFYDTDETMFHINQVDDDTKEKHTTSGCFIQTLGIN